MSGSHRRCLVDLVGGYRCDLPHRHTGHHAVAGQRRAQDDSIVRLNQARWRVLEALCEGRPIVVPPATRAWLLRRGWISLAGKRHLSTGFEVTEAGRVAFGKAVRDWDCYEQEKEKGEE